MDQFTNGLEEIVSGHADLSPRRKRLAPEDNKFHRGSGPNSKHYWLTPPQLYEQLNLEFGFTFDPCPFPRPEEFDGLTCEWGTSNYVNPPFGSIMHKWKRKGPTAWAKKALEEYRKGKCIILAMCVGWQ